jgi:hypothetical protein
MSSQPSEKRIGNWCSTAKRNRSPLIRSVSLRELEAVAARRYEAGKTSFQDVVKIQVKTKVLTEDLITLKEKQRSIETTMTALLNVPPMTTIGYPVTTGTIKKLPRIENLYPMAENRRQEILISMHNSRKCRLCLKWQKQRDCHPIH